MANSPLSTRCESCNICGISLFKNLGQETLFELSDQKSESIVKKGQVIFNESNLPNGVYAIASGAVKLYKRGKEGKEQIVRLAGPGAVLGYRAILCDETFGISATALEETHLCFVPRQYFEELLNKEGSFTQELLKELSKELGQSRNAVVDIVQKSVLERIAETLLNLNMFYGVDEQTKFLSKTVSRTHIAQLCGATLESTVRALKELEKDGFISLHKKDIRIENRQRLAELAGIHF